MIIANAQENKESTVKLRSGIIVRGDIVEQIPNESITVRTADGDVFVYRMNEVASIKYADEVQKKEIAEKKLANGGKFMKNKGYEGSVFGFFGADALDYGQPTYGVNIINGYRFNPYFYIGLGVGYRRFLNSPAHSIPLYLNLKANFIKDRRVSPFVSVNAGVNLLRNKFYLDEFSVYIDELDTEHHIECMLGVDIYLAKRCSLLVAASFMTTWWWYPEFQAAAPAISVGFSF
ncbi:MAG: hypothetical protein IJ348_06485 [Alistipes sp.]|nr:hypothetical protein [Alistipes sp.]